jgi:hypothetical protein
MRDACLVLRFLMLLVPLVASLADTSAGDAERQPIATDRPGFMDSPVILLPGVAQLEGGSVYSVAGGAESILVGGHVIRMGLTDRLEVRMSQDGFFQPRSGMELAGWTGGSLGAKLKLADERKHRPNLSLVTLVSMPYGSECCSARDYNPTIKLSWSKGVAKGFGLGGNLNVSALSDDAGQYQQHAASVALARAVGKYSIFAEAYVYDRVERGGARQAYFDSGVSRRIGSEIQLDISAGHSFISTQPEWFIAVGFSMRLGRFGIGRLTQ